jgi:short subunit dehydrogenase-like uncharacterized protein
MSDPLLLYGATGYSGRLITQEAVRGGLRPVLCGRNGRALAALAELHGLSYRVARLDDAAELDRALADMRVVLHAAGPFSGTARPMVEACLRSRTHYLDIAGEPAVMEALAQRHAEARRQQIMIMPAVGFDVVLSDCLAAHVAARLPGAERLVFGLRGMTLTSRGSARTFVEQAGRDILIRRNGVLVGVTPESLQHAFDYGDGLRTSVNVTWGDVVAAYYTTGIPNIEVYFEATPLFRNALLASRYIGPLMTTAPWQIWMKTAAEFLPAGPTDEERAAIETVTVAEAHDGRGRCARARLRARQAYTMTSLTAPAIARRVLHGDTESGFQTPGRVYGADFILSFPDVHREDIE